MKTPLINKSFIRKWGRNIFSTTIFIGLFQYQEAIQKISYINEIFFILIVISFFYVLVRVNNENEKIKSGNRIKLKSQIDNLNTILSLLLGFLIIGFTLKWNASEMVLLEKVNYSILGIILIISGLANRKSIILDKKDTLNIEVLESDLKIQSSDKNITFTTFQIILTKENGQTEHLKDLVLDFKEASRISNWLDSGLNKSNLNYCWKGENKIEKIKTDTNNT